MAGRRTLTGAGLAVALSALALAGSSLAAPERSAGEGDTGTARSSAHNERLVRHLTRGRRPVLRRIRYRGVCSVECLVAIRSRLILPGPDVATPWIRAKRPYAAKQVFEAFIQLKRADLRRLRRNRRRARLRAVIRARDTMTGDTDVDRRVFRFRLRRRAR
jgi:hypothetical protein